MCQLLGMNANTPTDVMFSFTGLATRAHEHKDGFGIAFFEGHGLRLFVDHVSARQSPVAELVKHYPIKSDNVIAHIRKATQGRVALENTHPFMRELWGRYWVFAHNGDLKDFHPRLHAAFKPVGDRRLAWRSDAPISLLKVPSPSRGHSGEHGPRADRPPAARRGCSVRYRR